MDIEELHRAACARGDPTYADPKTGYLVFTADTLRSRKKCCGCGCRHCGEAFPATGLAARKAAAAAAAAAGGGAARPSALPPSRMLHGSREALDDCVDVLFWSGGKDSYLALRQLAREAAGPSAVLLLTTFDGRSEIVAHQEVTLDVVVRQARSLSLPLVGVPLDGSAGDYLAHVSQALAWVAADGVRIRRLAFGDLHLAHVRTWRDQHLSAAAAAAAMYYPLWGRDYALLRRELLDECGVTTRVCAVACPARVGGKVKVGDLFDADLLARLPDSCDAFGEGGEFHSVVEVWAEGAAPLPWGEQLPAGPVGPVSPKDE